MKLRMRTKFLLSMLLISAGLTWTSLLLVRHTVQAQVTKSIFADLHNSVTTYQNFHREREITLTHLAELLADLPNLRALMTTQHEATIQDGSTDLWRLGGSDLFVLANRTGKVVALHTATPGFSREMAQQSLNRPSNGEGTGQWWFGAQHLYQVFLKPIYAGPAAENNLLGFLVIGYEIDDTVAAQVSRIAASQVAFYYGETIVRSTLDPTHEAELSRHPIARSAPGIPEPERVQLGDERFLATSLELTTDRAPSVRLSVLKSYDQATAFLDSLNSLLLFVGLTAVLGGSALVFFISHTFTKPLGNLVAGVRALGRGDFHYHLDARGGDEVAEVTGAFNRMRDSLLKTQQELIDAERLATIGRMASSVSHDLRHSLAAIVANAEFLLESHLSTDQREELYQEIRIAVNQMTDLIDSLLEFSRTRESLRRTYGSVKESVDRVVQAVRTHPRFHAVRIVVRQEGSSTGWFDTKKLERALYNLLLNACEAIAGQDGQINIDLREVVGGLEIRLSDNGRGIPESIRGRLFEPFISYGKENGTGLGLTVVQKIIQDHGGDVTVEKTSAEGTVFRITLPIVASSNSDSGGEGTPHLPALSRAKRVPSE
ncbi:MAG TPA: HAMP domain-containing sensor histidine kinase [Terriglobales bacterium]|jgi:signal transduction histidine kinase|nr:HAMP domain-containing sensor histidine kinase [Terriglobales bacterium]